MLVVEEPSDLRIREIRQVLADVHRHLAREGDRAARSTSTSGSATFMP